MSMPRTVAVMVPSGIDRLGLRRSPDSPTPAVMPVNAGKQIAKTTKNESVSVSDVFHAMLPSCPETG